MSIKMKRKLKEDEQLPAIPAQSSLSSTSEIPGELEGYATGNDLQPNETDKRTTSGGSGDISTSEGFAEHAQIIIDELAAKRKSDETLLSEFRKTMEVQTESWCESLERTLGKVYERNNGRCQEKLQELYTILGRINQLEQEMSAFKQSLKMLYSDVEKT